MTPEQLKAEAAQTDHEGMADGKPIHEHPLYKEANDEIVKRFPLDFHKEERTEYNNGFLDGYIAGASRSFVEQAKAKVKPLVWKEEEFLLSAETPFGKIVIFVFPGGWHTLHAYGKQISRLNRNEAKSAAQAHFTAKLLESFTPETETP